MIEFHNIIKNFGGVRALRGVSLAIARGECHALMGENGAGKSTLGKVLAGIHQPDEGFVTIDGQRVPLRSPADAANAGIGMVHQELAFCPDLSVAENLAMGNYPRRGRLFLDRAAMRKRAESLLSRINVRLNVEQSMRQLSTAQEQMVQIASAVGTGAKILVFDEPTSSLSESESLALFTLIESLKASGVTIIYVSHRMPEVFRLSDAISVLRDGEYAGTLKRGNGWTDASRDEVVRMMIGRELPPTRVQASRSMGDEMLRVSNLTCGGRFADVGFSIRAGEIVGFAGLVGSGRSEVALAVFGLDPQAKGRVDVGGVPLPLGKVRTAMSAGIGLVPEDRKRQGLVLMHSGRMNFALPSLERFSRLGFVRRGAERLAAERLFGQLRVKTPSIDTPVNTMSGGNQQKVVIAKWLARGGKVLIVDEPTRGVDVGAKAAIHDLLRELAREGVAIMVISSELPEVLALSDRIMVMRDGRLVGELKREEADQEKIVRLMAGVA